MFKKTSCITPLFLALIATAGTAVAAEGVLEINQTCAETTGCFPGDTPGFPVTLSGSSGAKSFILTGDLATSTTSQSMISVLANRITLDLGGFSISNSQSTSGSADVINGNLVAGYATIRNGSIRGGGGQGVDFSSTGGTRVEDILFLNQGGGAILVGENSMVRNNRVTSSAAQSGPGISVGERSEVSHNFVDGASGDGIGAGEGCTISGNTVSDNGERGIFADRGSNVIENTVYDNGTIGIEVLLSARISGNNVYSNEGNGISVGFYTLVSDNLVSMNGGAAGVFASGSAMVIGNSVFNLGGPALDLGGSHYRNNTVYSFALGLPVTGGIDGGGNSCNGTTTCP